MHEPIFPGMDPFIESQRWIEFRRGLLVEIRRYLCEIIVPRYGVALQDQVTQITSTVRAFAPARPDENILNLPSLRTTAMSRVIKPTISDIEPHQWLEIRDDEGKLVTVIEVLSPANKGKHRDRYLANRDSSILYSDVHLIEIDLLRGGQRMEAEISTEGYAILVARSQTDSPHRGELYEIGLRDALPVIPVPLKPSDADVPLDMLGIFKNLYIRARYRLQLDYTRPVKPTLSPDDQIWVDAILKAAFPDR